MTSKPSVLEHMHDVYQKKAEDLPAAAAGIANVQEIPLLMEDDETDGEEEEEDDHPPAREEDDPPTGDE